MAQNKTKLKKPSWLKMKIPQGEQYHFILNQRKKLQLATVCEEARCPNIGECWSTGTATFMIMGDTCTRGCRFCSVKTKKYPNALDTLEPTKLADTLQQLALKYVVITTVDRDDLLDQGSNHITACIQEVLKKNPLLRVEILMPDFRGDQNCIDQVTFSGASVIAHNVETVERLTRYVRDPRAGYRQSLDVLKHAKSINKKILTKSSLMVGFGEKQAEIIQAMEDMREVDVDFLTIGQYLQPTQNKLPVTEFVHPDIFAHYREVGEKLGFKYVASNPMVRSSYKAAEYFIHNYLNKNLEVS